MHIVNISTGVDNNSLDHVDCPSISGGLRSDLIYANNYWPQRPADLPESPSNGKPLDPAAFTPLMQRSAFGFSASRTNLLGSLAARTAALKAFITYSQPNFRESADSHEDFTGVTLPISVA